MGCIGMTGDWIFFFQAEDGIRDYDVTGVQTCALPIFHSAILSTSIGITMGLDEKTISEMGLGCLLHDIGMLAVAEHADTPRNFEVKQFMEIATHPVHTLELIQRQYNSVPD